MLSKSEKFESGIIRNSRRVGKCQNNFFSNGRGARSCQHHRHPAEGADGPMHSKRLSITLRVEGVDRDNRAEERSKEGRPKREVVGQIKGVVLQEDGEEAP